MKFAGALRSNDCRDHYFHITTLNLFEPLPDFSREKAHMVVVDRLNHQMGAGSLQWAGAGLKPSWQMKQQKRSPRYTTRWDEIPVVLAQ